MKVALTFYFLGTHAGTFDNQGEDGEMFSIVEYWKKMKGAMPVLYSMHLDYCPVQGNSFINLGSSAASERAFSQSGRIISTDRCSLSGESIEILMMEKNRLAPATEALRKEMNKILGRKQVFYC